MQAYIVKSLAKRHGYLPTDLPTYLHTYMPTEMISRGRHGQGYAHMSQQQQPLVWR